MIQFGWGSGAITAHGFLHKIFRGLGLAKEEEKYYIYHCIAHVYTMESVSVPAFMGVYQVINYVRQGIVSIHHQIVRNYSVKIRLYEVITTKYRCFLYFSKQLIESLLDVLGL